MLQYPVYRLPYVYTQTMTQSTDKKLDALINSVAELKRSHEQSQKDLDGRLKKLEEDVPATQEDVTERKHGGTTLTSFEERAQRKVFI